MQLKAKSTLHPVDETQVLSYLRKSMMRLSLLMNRHDVRFVDGVLRVIRGYSSI